jgi:hypothetical protein
MTLQLHRPDASGALRPGAETDGDWRDGLHARRWRVAPLRNSEMNPTPTLVAIAFWVALAVLTFALLMLGYGTHFWTLPAAAL